MDRRYLLKRENPRNRLLTVDAVETIMRDNGLDLRVNDIAVYQRAFVHRSYLKNAGGPQETHQADCIPLQDGCNETYEFLGDTILGSVIGTYLYDRYYDQNEGFLTKTRTKMVRGTTLGELAKRLNFGEYVIISEHVENEGGRTNLRILEDLFESFIAAIYLDNGSEPLSKSWFAHMSEYKVLRSRVEKLEEEILGAKILNPEMLASYIACNRRLRQLSDSIVSSRSNGYIYCQRFIMSVYERYVDIVKLISHDDNYKDRLQHYFQSVGDTFPTWELMREEGKTNNRWHTVGVKDRFGYLIGVGREKKKTDAEQLASKNALIYLGVIQADREQDYLFD